MMSSTLIGWLLLLSSLAISSRLLFALRGSGRPSPLLDIEACKSSLAEIGARLKRGKLTEAEADAERLALLLRLRPAGLSLAQGLQSVPKPVLAGVAAFVLIAGFGAALSSGSAAFLVPAAAQQSAGAVTSSGDDDIARLAEYAGTPAAAEVPPHAAPGSGPGTGMPDVDTMIERLAARLDANPQDLEGWRLLGWSYFHTARYAQAASAFGRALAIDPAAADLKQALEDAKAKASDGATVSSPSSSSLSSNSSDAKRDSSDPSSGSPAP